MQGVAVQGLSYIVYNSEVQRLRRAEYHSVSPISNILHHSKYNNRLQ